MANLPRRIGCDCFRSTNCWPSRTSSACTCRARPRRKASSIGRRWQECRAALVLINTARGGLVDEEALADALESGHLWGAGLDVFAAEPPPATLRLLKFDNVLLSPHMAGLDDASIEAMERLAAECLVSLYRTGTVPEGCLVNPPSDSGWRWTR